MLSPPKLTRAMARMRAEQGLFWVYQITWTLSMNLVDDAAMLAFVFS